MKTQYELRENVFKGRQQEWILKIGRPMLKSTRNMADRSQTAYPQEKNTHCQIYMKSNLHTQRNA